LPLTAGSGGALPSAYGEYEVKSALIYNFARFIDWPPAALGEPEAPLIIGVIGNDAFGSLLDATMLSKTISGRPVEVRQFESLPDLKSCHILFVGVSEKKQVRRILQSIGRAPILTVGDGEEFAGLGGVIGFLLDGRRVRFEINLDAAERAGLQVSSKLLRLAKVRRDTSQQARN
jgi:hypothetical protein